MIVEKGVPRYELTRDNSGSGVLESAGVGQSTGQRRTALPGEEADSDEDDDGDDTS